MKRFSILLLILCASTFAMAQKADVAFVAGGSFVIGLQCDCAVHAHNRKYA